MRPLALVVIALLAAPASAQSQFMREAGPYASIDALDPLRLGDGEVEALVSGGWRFGNGLDVGVRLGAGETAHDAVYETDLVGTSRAGTAGVEAGYTHHVSGRTGLRLAGSTQLWRTVRDRAPYTVTYEGGEIVEVNTTSASSNRLRAGLELTSFTRVPLGGSIVLQPTAGLFLAGNLLTDTAPGRPFSLRADSGRSSAFAEAGAALGLPVSFRALGNDVTVDLRGGVDFAEMGGPFTGTRLRLNF